MLKKLLTAATLATLLVALAVAFGGAAGAGHVYRCDPPPREVLPPGSPEPPIQEPVSNLSKEEAAELTSEGYTCSKQKSPEPPSSGGSGGVGLGFDDQEFESGDIETETSLSIEGNNNNQCARLLEFGQSGNFGNQQGTAQDDVGPEFEQEFEGPEIEFAPENETACEHAVQQAAAASSFEP